MAECKTCGEIIGKGEYFKHMWAEHPEEARANLKKAQDAARELKIANSKPRKPAKNGAQQDTAVAVKSKVTENIAEAVSIFIAPKTFQMSSVLLWQAREAAIREWNWPADISPEDFLDTYLYNSYLQRGICLGAYQVLDKKDGQAKN